MATNTAGSTARVYHQGQTHYIDAPLSVANTAIGATFKIGTVPGGATMLRAGLGVSVVFNSGTLNNVSLGLTSGGTTLVTNTTGLAALGRTDLTVVASLATVTVDTDIYFTTGLTGTPATTGAANVWVEYYVPSAALV